MVLYGLCFTRPRYQVSVYRTNGPLVSLSLVFVGCCEVVDCAEKIPGFMTRPGLQDWRVRKHFVEE